LHKGKLYTTGSIKDISKGGLLTQLLVQRAITIYDKLELKIALFDTSGGDLVNSVHGELLRIEHNAMQADKKTGYYAFKFVSLDQTQIKFIETLTEWLEQKAANE
jgi:hypothetical protein